MFKNVASQKIALFAFDTTTGTAKSGDAANITAYVSKDSGAVTVLGDTSATEMDATNAKGWYLFDLTQAETNADTFLFTGKSTTANISIVGQPISALPASFTSSVAQTGDSYARLGAPAGASVSADIDALPTAIENADALLKRDWTSVTGEAARSVLNALRFLRNKWSISTTTLTVTKEDDSTAAWTSTVTATAGADPITGNDPT